MSHQQESSEDQKPEMTKISTLNSSPLGTLGYGGMSDEDKIIRKRALRKLDMAIIPSLLVLWLLAFLDRSSVGNAKIAGLTESLNLKGLEFSTGLALFYVFYIAIELPSNLILKKVSAKLFLPGIVIAWGIVTTLSGLVQDVAGFYVIRSFLGLCEGGLLPGMVFYLSLIYQRHELQYRIACFFASAGLSGSFGGLLAYGLTQMDGLGDLEGWRWIFIIEGIATVVLALVCAYFLPASISRSKLTNDEKRVCLAAVGHDLGGSAQANSVKKPTQDPDGEKNHVVSNQEDVAIAQAFEKEAFEWYEVRRGLKSFAAWNTGVAYLLVLNSLYSFTLFLPTILEPLFDTSDQARIQLLTVPPFVPATALTIFVAIFADKWKKRGIFILCLLPISMIGYIILIASESNSAKYAAVFLVAMGIYPVVPCILSILPNNNPNTTKRATVTALQLMVANCAGFVASFIYTSKFGPDFILSHSVMLGSLGLSWILIAGHVIWCTRENNARREGRRDHHIAEYEELVRSGKTKAPIGDRSPSFVLTV